MKLTGAQILWECLMREGVTDVFGYPGGAILPVYDAMGAYPVRHILVRHEQGAVHMADGYARASGRTGVALATSGPGATNMVTGIATAMMDSSPIVCITGQVGSTVIGTDAFQETDITGVTLPLTKHSYLVTRADQIAHAVREAFAVAEGGRPGPVLIDITKDAQQETCPFDPRQPPRLPRSTPFSAEDGVGTLADAVALLAQAERPVILAGHGLILGRAEDELRVFAEAAHIPVAATLLGIGALPASHPLYLGMMGLHGQAWVNQAIQEADLLIALGMRFDDRVTGAPSHYAPHAAKIQIDIDASEIGKIIPVSVGLVGDVRALLPQLIPPSAAATRQAWTAYVAHLRETAAAHDICHQPDDGHLYAPHVVEALSRLTGGRAVVATDVGQHQMWEARSYRHEGRRSLITSGGLGAMGFALPAAIGAKVACPEAEVWVVVGDGGFQMTMGELATIVQERLDINVAIINNATLGMVRQLQHFFYEQRFVAVPIGGPDIERLAGAYGLRGRTVTSRADVDAAIAEARSLPGAVLIDFRVRPDDLVYPHVKAGAALDQMYRRPLPFLETSVS